MSKRSIVDFFDPNLVEHILALKCLEDTGLWPHKFIPADVEFPTNWAINIYAKIARKYIDDLVEINKSVRSQRLIDYSKYGCNGEHDLYDDGEFQRCYQCSYNES